MRKYVAGGRPAFAVFMIIYLGMGPLPLYAAAKAPAKTEEKPALPSVEEPAENSDVKVPLSEKSLQPGKLPEGKDIEKLLYTLNETLEENRKIRQSMRDLQQAFEKVTLEKSDLMGQVRKVEQLAIQRNKDTGLQVEGLSVQLDGSKKEMEKLQSENKASVDQKLALEKMLETVSAEKKKMQEVLKLAVLAPERDQIVEQMKQNDAAVKDAVEQISSLDSENVKLREQVIQSYFDLGNMFYDLGRYQDAAVQYLNVLSWNPNHAWAHHNLAVIYDYHMHKVRKAMMHYEQYLHVKLASEDAREARIRLWDLQKLSDLEPAQPLKEDFEKFRKL